MSSFGSSALQLWILGLCLAVTLTGLSLAAIFVFATKRRQDEEEDPAEYHRIEQRLIELTHADIAPPAKSA